jgi:hypothetical protein
MLDDTKIRRMGHLIRMEDERIPHKRFLMGNFVKKA